MTVSEVVVSENEVSRRLKVLNEDSDDARTSIISSLLLSRSRQSQLL